jgi:hypothetical protein
LQGKTKERERGTWDRWSTFTEWLAVKASNQIEQAVRVRVVAAATYCPFFVDITLETSEYSPDQAQSYPHK